MSLTKIQILVVSLAVIAVLSTSVAGFLYWENSKLKEENNNISTQTKDQDPTTKDTAAEDTSNQDAASSTIELKGFLNLVYGDPQNENEAPRYSYSVSDDQGKTTELKFTDDTKYSGGKKASDFDRKKVKITGELIPSTDTVEVLTIELE